MKRCKFVAMAMVIFLIVPVASHASRSGGSVSAVGTWKLNIAESIAPQGRTYSPATFVLEEAGQILDFTYHGTHDGKPFEFSWHWKSDGTVRQLAPGLKGTMTRLPSGNYRIQFWTSRGSHTNEYCQLIEGGTKNICLGVVRHADGSVAFFQEVFDRQVS